MPSINFDMKNEDAARTVEECFPHIEENPHDVLEQIKNHIQMSEDMLQNSTVIFWLTHLIRYGVQNKNSNILSQTTQIIFSLTRSHPELLASMLCSTIPSGREKSLTILYLWMNNFYLATFEQHNYIYIEKMDEILNALLFDKKHQDLLRCFTQSMITDSSEEGKSPLFILSLAVLQAIEHSFSLASTKRVTALFELVSNNLGFMGHEHMVQRVNSGVFAGKSIVYFLACSLKKAARTNIDAVFMLCEVFKKIYATNPEKTSQELATLIETGPYKGYTPLHIILHSLISAAYIDNNIAIVQEMTSIVHTVCQSKEPSSLQRLLHIPIAQGLNKGQTGYEMLQVALEKSMLSKIPTDELESLIAVITKGGALPQIKGSFKSS